MSCPNKSTCPLFPMFRLKSALSVWQTNYCDHGHERCERFKLSQLRKPVPSNLLPNGKLLGVTPDPRGEPDA